MIARVVVCPVKRCNTNKGRRQCASLVSQPRKAARMTQPQAPSLAEALAITEQ